MWQSLSLISLGAVFGAAIRWGLGLWLNPLFSGFAFGTLMANYLGCFIMGGLLALSLQIPSLNDSYRLFLITGFLGSLTTFSAFAAEIMENLLRQYWWQAFGVLALHLFGGLLSTLFGFVLWRLISKI